MGHKGIQHVAFIESFTGCAVTTTGLGTLPSLEQRKSLNGRPIEHAILAFTHWQLMQRPFFIAAAAARLHRHLYAHSILAYQIGYISQSNS